MIKQKSVNSKSYTITLTDEHIKTIRSLYLHLGYIATSSRGTARLNEDGSVEHVMIHTCTFCNQGSHESVAAIVHDKTCWIPRAMKEFDSLNHQFIEAMDITAEEQAMRTACLHEEGKV